MLRNLLINTDYGQTAFLYRGWSERPTVVMIHGFGRDLSDLYRWQDELPYEVIFARLPGYQSQRLKPELGYWTDAFRQAFTGFPTPPLMVIGESLGGLVALGSGLPSVAIDPFLDTSRLWPIEAAVQAGRAKGINVSQDFVDGLFGGQNHSAVLERITAPALVLAGNVPLHPPQPGRQVSLLSDEDEALFAAHPRVTVQRIPGAHLLLTQNPAACRDLIVQFGQSVAAALSGSLR